MVTKVTFVGDNFLMSIAKLEIHQAYGSKDEEGPCNASRTESHILSSDNWSQEEPQQPNVHQPGRYHKGDSSGGEHQRTRLGDLWGQGGLGQVRSGDQQPRERRLYQCSATGQ